MIINLSTTIRTARVTTLKTAIDGASAAGKIKFYDGTQPSTGAGITTQNLVGTMTLAYPCGTVSGQTLTLSSVSDITAALETYITWCRVTDHSDVFCMDLDVTATGGGGACVIDNTHVYSGGTIRLISATFSD